MKQKRFKKITPVCSVLLLLFIFSNTVSFAVHDYKTFEAAKQAEAQGDYKGAYDLYQKYLSTSDDIWSKPFAEKKVAIISPILEVYYEAPGNQAVYYGAKNEPKSGVYFGTTYSQEDPALFNDKAALKQKYTQKETGYLVYLEFDQQERLDQDVTNGLYFNDIKEHFTAETVVEIAWNTYRNHSDDIESYFEYIRSTLETLQSVGCKVLLRFANEMNVGPNGMNASQSEPAPEEYKKVFRYVSGLVKPYSNIAMVWSPNDVGAIDRPFELFYPGDDHVDWVGVSLYPLKYFQNNPATTDTDATYFLTGPYAHPLIKLAQVDRFMKEHNIKKPLMISEGAAAHYIDAHAEDTTDWALMQVRRMYTDLPRYFPNLKAMFFFNVNLAGRGFRYALYDSLPLLNLYNEVTAAKHFIKEGQTASEISYQSVENASFNRGDIIPLSSAVYYPNANALKVQYFVDGNHTATTEQTPYSYAMDTSGLASGAHTLTVKVLSGDKIVNETQKSFTIQDNIKVVFNGKQLKIDLPILMRNDRTYYPLRQLFEAMGATVTWDDATQTVHATLDKNETRFTIGSENFTANGRTQRMDPGVSPFIENDRTYIPIRFAAEGLGFRVDWNENTSTITIA